jgi:hypothetical protein
MAHHLAAGRLQISEFEYYLTWLPERVRELMQQS